MEHNTNILPPDGLSEAALGMLAAIGRLGDADRVAVLRAHGLALGPRLWRVRDGTGLPTLTGLVPDRDRDTIYASRAWAESYRPTHWIVAYVLQAPGLARLSARLGGVGLAKAGTSSLRAVERRTAGLDAAEYGAWHRGEHRYQRDTGFDAFGPAPRLQLAAQHVRSPVRLGPFGIEIGLPAGLSHGRFEVEYNMALLPLRLQHLAGTAAGRDVCARAGISPAELNRFYRRSGRYCLATELTLLRPQADCGALAKMCSDLIIDHVLGLLPRRSGR